MPPPIEERRPPITPQLAVRVAVLGGFAFVLFAVLFFRLWFLQVLTGDDYVVQARENRIRKVKIEAPRGNIVDRDGRTLVKTRAAPVVQILPNSVPDAGARRRRGLPQAARRGRGPPARRRADAARARARGCAPTAAARRGASARGCASCARAARRADKVRDRPDPGGRRRSCASLYKRLGHVLEHLAARRSTGA